MPSRSGRHQGVAGCDDGLGAFRAAERAVTGDDLGRVGRGAQLHGLEAPRRPRRSGRRPAPAALPPAQVQQAGRRVAGAALPGGATPPEGQVEPGQGLRGGPQQARERCRRHGVAHDGPDEQRDPAAGQRFVSYRSPPSRSAKTSKRWTAGSGAAGSRLTTSSDSEPSGSPKSACLRRNLRFQGQARASRPSVPLMRAATTPGTMLPTSSVMGARAAGAGYRCPTGRGEEVPDEAMAN